MGDFEYPEIKKNSNNKDSATDGWLGRDIKYKEGVIQNCHTEELLGLGRKNKIKGKQSPVNINTSSVQDCHLMCQLEINYNPIDICKIYKNKQGIINFDWDENSYITFNKLKYPLKKIYFHTPSHHLIDGNSSDMEINLYHTLSENYLPDSIDRDIKDTFTHNQDEITKNKNEKEKLKHHKGIIISILVKEDKIHSASSINKFISQFITNPYFKDLKREHNNEIKVGKNWNIKSLLPKKKSFFSYEGSLPMPPCLEPYTWIVFEEPINMYLEYIDIIRREGNPKGFRNAHPLNGRIILYNTSVEIHEETIDDESKTEIINKMLAPIRITVDSRTGVDYRIGARKIIDSYMGGTNQDYRENEESLTEINLGWDKLGKSGTQDLTIIEILNLKEKNPDKYYDYVQNMIFNALVYNLEDYFDKYMENSEFKKKYLEKSEDKTEEEFLTEVNSILEELSKLNISGDFFLENDKKTYTFEIVKSNFTSKKDTLLSLANNILDLTDNKEEKFLLFLLFNWKMNNVENNNFTNLFSFIEDSDEIYKFNNFILNELFTSADRLNISEGKKNNIKNLIFKFQGEDLTFTLDGEECQDWGSNEVHYEGSLIGRTNLFSKNGYTFDELKKHTNLIDAARDGLLNKVNGKWKPHNKCRDPGGLKGATWCYTKNPKVRWGYCMVPDRVGNSKKYILFVIFILLIVVSIIFVKMIFREELLTQLIAKLTGANIATEAVFKANQVANSIKSKIN